MLHRCQILISENKINIDIMNQNKTDQSCNYDIIKSLPWKNNRQELSK